MLQTLFRTITCYVVKFLPSSSRSADMLFTNLLLLNDFQEVSTASEALIIFLTIAYPKAA